MRNQLHTKMRSKLFSNRARSEERPLVVSNDVIDKNSNNDEIECYAPLMKDYIANTTQIKETY